MVNDVIDGTPVVVLTAGDGKTANVFSPIIDETTLRFDQTNDGYVDDATASVWTAAGEALSGPLAGRSLSAVPSQTTFWFAYVAAFPDAELYEP